MKGVWSMEIIWVAWFFGGLVMGFACCHFAYIGTEDDDGTDKEQSDRDNDIRIYHPSADRKHRSVDRHSNYAPEEMIFVLNNVTRLTYGWEREIMDGVIDLVEKEKSEDD